jgi:hypothetical protein
MPIYERFDLERKIPAVTVLERCRTHVGNTRRAVLRLHLGHLTKIACVTFTDRTREFIGNKPVGRRRRRTPVGLIEA